MINLFQVAPTDQSIAYLSQIFGTVSGVLTNTVYPQTGAITLLSTMFKIFNGVILTIAVLMLVYITIIGVISTAHEGEFMGRKMNNIWIPIRAVLGIALLVPTGAGYCAIQIVMMWVIVQGVGAADVLWNTALGFVSVQSPYSSVSVTGVQTTQALNGLFQGLVCQASLGKGAAAPTFDPSKNCSGGQCSYTLANGCGSLTFCDQSAAGSCSDATSVQCVSCQAQVAALQPIITQIMSPVAQYFVAADTSYQNFAANSSITPSNPSWKWIQSYCSSHQPPIPTGTPNQCCFGTGIASIAGVCQAPAGNMPSVNDSINNQSDPQNASFEAVQNLYWTYWPQLAPSLGVGSNFISVAVTQYSNMANAAYTSYIAAQGQNLAKGNSGILSTASSNGWIYGGAMYYAIASSNNNTLKGSIPVLSWNSPNMSDISGSRNNYNAALYLIQAANGNATQGASSPQLENLSSSLSSVPATVAQAFSDNVHSTGGNPLITLVALGSTFLLLATIIFTVTAILVIALAVALAASSFTVLGTGDPGLIGYIAPVEMFILPAFYAGLALLVTIGATLGIYTPLLPFIYFTFGAIAWMISTVEAMVAGPLVALFIINPKGEHELMGKAEPALMLLFNIFLRPSLMIFGLMAAMLLATVVVSLINATFGVVFDTGGVAKYDPLSLILVLCAYVGLVLAGLNKCFQVINLIPQQVMRWISGQGEGVEAPTQEVKGTIDAGAAKGGGAATSSQGTYDSQQKSGVYGKGGSGIKSESKTKGKVS